MEQIGIALTGVIAIFLTQDRRDHVRRWACVFGLLGQPFWIYAAWQSNQMGVLLVSVLYAFAWAQGFWKHWIAKEVS